MGCLVSGYRVRLLWIYFVILFSLGSIIVWTAIRTQNMFLTQVYMITPAIAAIITRAFFIEDRFQNSGLRIGNKWHYIRVWAFSLLIILSCFLINSLTGNIVWDFSGEAYLESVQELLIETEQNVFAQLPEGISPSTMIILFFIGGLTIFNVFNILSGFGEEYGHRGLMFPILYEVNPYLGLIGGGAIWYLWHLPLTWITLKYGIVVTSFSLLHFIIVGIGTISTHIYLSYIYMKHGSIFITSFAHITMNNISIAFSYFGIIKDAYKFNIILSTIMLFIILLLFYKKHFNVGTQLHSALLGR